MTATINASTSSGLVQTADTSGTLELQSNGTTQLTVSSTGAYGQLKRATAQTSTSGTSIDFTSIPSWVKRITVVLGGVSLSGTSNFLIQIGDGAIVNTGYVGSGSAVSTSAANSTGGLTSTAGFPVNVAVAAYAVSGLMTLVNISGNIWVSSHAMGGSNDTRVGGGIKTLTGTLDRVRITTVNGTDTFDAGSINILYEG